MDLAAAGAEVCIAARTQSQLDETSALIEAATGRKPLAVPTNVQDSSDCDALIAKTVEHFGRLDIMVNNAGIGDRRGAGSKIWDMADDDWHDTIAVNLHGTFYCSRAAAKVMRDQDQGGVIVNVASGTAMRANPTGFAYATAKGGVISLTKSLAGMLVSDNIRVNCIIPGFIAQHEPESQEEYERVQARGKFNTARRLGEAWEMGPLAVFLCSEASSYVTGECFVIDGGGLAGGIAPVGYAMEASR
jgi:NAD(P)-dependent dehydrogenase (short-subunit alcohol dehydrogenase family)